jgi:hypothetical protein
MTVSTKYNIGDKLYINGETREIRGVHIYFSDNKQTERYYLGNQEWLTIHTKESGKE